ncbi:MAG: hypothetical protein KDI47_10410 [Gammaproteobacteria bacterium]|nr:hypothetical protein [Gammaproteobacteria bacterium]
MSPTPFRHVIEPPEELRRSLAKALDFPGQRRVCGDRHLCPAGVVRMVRVDSATATELQPRSGETRHIAAEIRA